MKTKYRLARSTVRGDDHPKALHHSMAYVIEHPAIPYLAAGLIIAFLVLPIIFMFSTSLKADSEVFSYPPSYIPHSPTVEPYARVLRSPLPRHLLNSLIISLGTTLVVMGLAVPTTYGIVHYPYRGRGLALLLLLITRLVPPVALVSPFFLMLSRLQLVDTYAGLIVLNVFLTFPLAVWLLMPFFEAFPRELLGAALVDGCSRLRAFVAVVMPLTISGIVAVGSVVFLWTWNEFLFPLVFSSSPNIQPVTVGLRFFIGDEFVEWNAMAAGAMLTSLPAVILFAFAQRAIVKGLVSGALK